MRSKPRSAFFEGAPWSSALSVGGVFCEEAFLSSSVRAYSLYTPPPPPSRFPNVLSHREQQAFAPSRARLFLPPTGA